MRKPCMSLPSRKCGLKSVDKGKTDKDGQVTSFAEVWIEIIDLPAMLFRAVSLPSRKCGLKSLVQARAG